MSDDRSTEDVRAEIAREREQLGTAVGELKQSVGDAKAKLPLVAAGAAGVAVALGAVKRLISRRRR